MAENKSKIGRKLSDKSGWQQWLKKVLQEATRLNLRQNYENVLNGVAAGVPAAQQQKWRDLRSAIIDSLDGGAEAHIENHPNLNGLCAGGVVVALRDGAQFGHQSLSQQNGTERQMRSAKFAQTSDDIRSFLAARRQEMLRMPDKYPQAAGAPGDVDAHILSILHIWFTSGFVITIETLRAQNPAPDFEAIATAMEGAFNRLVDEGKYKVEAAKAFPAIGSPDYDETHGKGNKSTTSGGDGGGDSPPPCGGGAGSYFSKSKIRKIKQQARAEGRALAAGDGGAGFFGGHNNGKNGGKGRGKYNGGGNNNRNGWNQNGGNQNGWQNQNGGWGGGYNNNGGGRGGRNNNQFNQSFQQPYQQFPQQQMYMQFPQQQFPQQQAPYGPAPNFGGGGGPMGGRGF